MCSNLVKCMIFERNKELWLKINNKSLKKICVCETNISFLRLRPRLLVDGIKVWDWDSDFSLWSQILRLRLRLLTLVSRIETVTETLKRWSQGLRPRLRPPQSQSQFRDQSLAQLCIVPLQGYPGSWFSATQSPYWLLYPSIVRLSEYNYRIG